MISFYPDISILHISDIHRTPTAYVSNTELLSSLVADQSTYSTITPRIKNIDAIVCSGDIVQGLKLGSKEYPEGLDQQYAEAYSFLSELTDHFLQGDRSKCIIVPGNHDIDWNLSQKSMEIIPLRDNSDVAGLLRQPGYRWDWKSMGLYRIVDTELYTKRLNKFCEFHKKFYQGCEGLIHKINPSFMYSVHEIAPDVIVAGFNSCLGNDCFQYSGEISSEAISECHLTIQNAYPSARLKIAVWHHNFYGPPQHTDYMSRSTVDLLFSKGFRLGLHGHQHKSEGTPFSQHLQDEKIMAIVSAGSLTAGENELPHGVNRQFNIIELNLEKRVSRIHIREMVTEGIFSGGRHNFMGGKSYADIEYTEDVPEKLVDVTKGGGQKTHILDEIQQLISRQQHKQALNLIDKHATKLEYLGRRLKINTLLALEDWNELITFIGTPTNHTEFGIKYKALCETGNFKNAETLVNDALQENMIDHVTAKEFRMNLRAEKLSRGI